MALVITIVAAVLKLEVLSFLLLFEKTLQQVKPWH